MRNQCYADQFLISIFWAPIGGEKGVAATPVHKGLGLQNRTKKFSPGSFWVTCYLRIMFPKFVTLDPPLSYLNKTF